MIEPMKKNLPETPLPLFHEWLAQAKESEINDPEAMALATADANGRPDVRMVLLKEADERGFKFHSNARSSKGQDLEQRAQAALCFHWKSLRKQVRVRGLVERVSEAEADAYFAGRPYARQIGAWASAQSRPLVSREALEHRIAEYSEKYPAGKSIPRPPDWVGWRVVPAAIEFWWDNPDRLHDRFVYEKTGADWTITRLYP